MRVWLFSQFNFSALKASPASVRATFIWVNSALGAHFDGRFDCTNKHPNADAAGHGEKRNLEMGVGQFIINSICAELKQRVFMRLQLI